MSKDSAEPSGVSMRPYMESTWNLLWGGLTVASDSASSIGGFKRGRTKHDVALIPLVCRDIGGTVLTSTSVTELRLVSFALCGFLSLDLV